MGKKPQTYVDIILPYYMIVRKWTLKSLLSMLYNKLTFNQKFLAMNMTDQIKQNAYSWRHVCAKHFRLKRLQGYSVSFYLFS